MDTTTRTTQAAADRPRRHGVPPHRPCQKFARNYATRNLAPPHSATLGRASHQCGCVGT
jgi:hypothetical protein